MRKTLIALAAGLLTLSALPATAADLPGQTRPNAERPRTDNNRPDAQRQDGRDNDRRDNNRNDTRGDRNDDSRHGRWDARWGARPPAPPRHFTRTSDWNRHVRACQQRYRTYNARTDRYVPRRGQTAVCRL